MAMNIRDVVSLGSVIPELVLSDIAQALPTARALCAGGMRVMEISMRSNEAGACIEAVRKGVPDAIVGAGSLSRAVEFAAADRAGAQFGTTPGLTPDLAAASRGARFAIMPGAMTPTEVLIARNAGFMLQKSYAAHPKAGIPLLNFLHTAFPDVAFAPCGAMSAELAAQYLALPNVACVAGSWTALQTFIGSGEWQRIEEWARDLPVRLIV
jgi:2-dehydro-3-deoxyphosphogluconate aldolase/(4S)-4-hydroxy-2-oxoglutarate aldolase